MLGKALVSFKQDATLRIFLCLVFIGLDGSRFLAETMPIGTYS